MTTRSSRLTATPKWCALISTLFSGTLACSGPSGDSKHGGSAPSTTSGGTSALGTGGSSSGATGNSSGGSAGGIASSGGSSSGGSGENGGGGASGGDAPFVPPSCTNGTTELPPDAPVLTPGVWTPINPSETTFGSEGVFAQGMTLDPCNPATIYLTACANPVELDRNPGLYRTTNAGTSWTRVGDFDGPIRIRVDPADPLHLYVVQGVRGSTIGFWVSHDGGETWAQPQAFLDAAAEVSDNDVYHVDVDPTDFNHFLLTFHWYWHGCSDYGFGACTSGLFESTDGGDSFTIHNPDPLWAEAGGYDAFFLYNPALGIGDSQTWLYGSQGQGYYRTTNGGESWTKVTDNNMEHGGGQIYYTKDGTLYAAGIPNLMKSTDNGATWQLGSNPDKPNWGYIGIVGDGTHLYSSAHDHYGEVQTSLETDGINWTDFSDQISNAGAFEMAYDAANGIVYGSDVLTGLVALKVEN